MTKRERPVRLTLAEEHRIDVAKDISTALLGTSGLLLTLLIAIVPQNSDLKHPTLEVKLSLLLAEISLLVTAIASVVILWNLSSKMQAPRRDMLIVEFGSFVLALVMIILAIMGIT